MRQSRQRLFVAATAVRLSSTPKPPSEEKANRERIAREAEERGFARRDSAEAKIFMDQTFHAPQKIGDGVAVANLPEKAKEKTEFDQYQRSTTDFTSLVTPHGVTSVGLGAGFGKREDKRLGFLRPRTHIQPYTGSAEVVPKFDENGMPIEETLTRDQIMKKRMEYMKSFEGSVVSHTEHFLLADLDFEKDAMLFGNTREEFERNVLSLQKVIVAYNKWERTDNFYYYTTILLRLVTLWILMECLHQYYELQLLANSYDTFVDVMEAEIADLEERREKDFARARVNLTHSKPDFTVVIDAIRNEKRRLEEADAARAASSASSALPAVVERALGDASHPMDTTEEAAYLRAKEKEEEERQMRRLRDTASRSGEYSLWSSVWRKVSGPLSSSTPPLQRDDLDRFSYAASPTSIEAVRAIRRVLLPRSEDYTQVVREQMFQYKQEKQLQTSFPE